MENLFWATIAILATWRVTHLLQTEDGPWDLLARLRQRAGGSMGGRLLDCFYCLSLWVALVPALLLGSDWCQRLLLWPALSAGAILLQRLTHPEELDIEPLYYEPPPEEGREDELLRQETRTTGGGTDQDTTPPAQSAGQA